MSLILLVGPAAHAAAQSLPVGEQAPNVHHTGVVWLNHLIDADADFAYDVALATFEAGARLDWHVHPGGQRLLITTGIGYYQERGEPARVLRSGDVVTCPPGVEHWHAAAPESDFAYLAITANQPTRWLDRVRDAEYDAVDAPQDAPVAAQALVELSRQKWQWMSERRMDALAGLFHEDARFVHMGGTMSRDHELAVI